MSDELLPARFYGRVGFTTDGMVFLITDALDPDGHKIQGTFTWDPATAVRMAQDIADAAQEAVKFYNIPQKKAKKK